MHDPMTVAFEIKRPWREKPSKHWPKGYRPTWVTIWHVDPETDGSDDSCGWSFPRHVEADRKLARELADWETKFPYCFNRPWFHDGEYRIRRIAPGDAVALCIAAWHQIAWRLDRRSLTPRLLAQAALLGARDGDNFQSALAPFERDYNGHDERDHYERGFLLLIRAYRRATRPWYRHPRWHVWHWKLQIYPVLDLKRWLFSRCAGCGGRFAWGYAPVSTSWAGDGPSWFRGETKVYHHDCSRTSPRRGSDHA